MYHSSVKTPLYLDLYRKLREKIESGAFPVGYKLPSEKQIAEEHGVSRITSKHALDQLVNEGFIKRFPGKGSFVQSQTSMLSSEAAPVQSEGVTAGSRLIGVLMEDLSADFGGSILMGVERMCYEAGYCVVVKFSYGDEKREMECVNELLEIGVCGILVMCAYSEVYSPTIMKLSLDGFPMIFMDRCLRGLPVPYVGTNHLLAAKELTNEMIRRGHKHLALAMIEGSHTTSSAEDRILGYIEGCLEHDLLCANKRLPLLREDYYQPDPLTRQKNKQRMLDFLRDNPETKGILALTAGIADTLVHVLDDSSADGFTVATFDGPQKLKQVPCELFYVKQDQYLLGRISCQQLIEKINGNSIPQQTYIPYRVVEYPKP